MNDIDTLALDQALVGVADQEIVILEARIRAAQLSADVTALENLISDDLLFTGPDGQLEQRSKTLRRIGQALSSLWHTFLKSFASVV